MLNKYRLKLPGTILLVIFSLLTDTVWADLDGDVHKLQQDWAEINYQMQGKAQITAFEALVNDAEKITTANPDSADGWIWSGIIKSTYAGAKGGLGALKLAKSSKADLEKALSIEPNALNGSAYTSLGALYFNVPGWPIGFGSDEKAEELLQKALAINPEGIDSNYFYADFLVNQNRFEEARTYLNKAKNAKPRPDRPLADAGRHREIAELLVLTEKKIESQSAKLSF